MSATFPSGIASFTTKRNLLDDVDANDINRLQDEIVAIETLLGALLTDVVEVESQVLVQATDIATQDATDIQFQTNFTDLKARLAYIQAGYQIYAAEASKTNQMMSSQGAGQKPSLVTFSDPGTASDPKSMYNGTGFTLRKDGFWILNGHVRFDMTNSTASNNYGIYQATIGIGSHWERSMDRMEVTGTSGWQNVFLNPMAIGWFTRGTRISLRASQNTGHNQNVQHAWLSAVNIRTPE